MFEVVLSHYSVLDRCCSL